MKFEALVLWGAFTTVGGGIFAQAVEPAPGWLSVVIQGGSFTVLVYMVVIGIPKYWSESKADRQKERDDFAKAIADLNEDRRAERADFAGVIKTVTDFCRAEIEAVRIAAKNEVETLRSVFVQEQRETRATHASQMTSMQKVYMDSVGAMRSAVHDVRDTASQTINRANTAIELAKIKGEV